MIEFEELVKLEDAKNELQSVDESLQFSFLDTGRGVL